MSCLTSLCPIFLICKIRVIPQGLAGLDELIYVKHLDQHSKHCDQYNKHHGSDGSYCSLRAWQVVSPQPREVAPCPEDLEFRVPAGATSDTSRPLVDTERRGQVQVFAQKCTSSQVANTRPAGPPPCFIRPGTLFLT